MKNYNLLKKELTQYEHLYTEITRMEELTFDQITILDGNAKVLVVGQACKESFGITEEEMIGEHASNLKQKGIFDKSITIEVLKQRKKVILVQTTASKKTLMVTGFPVFNEKKEIVKIINISKDITDIEKSKKSVGNEGHILGKSIIQKKEIISNNSEMKKILDLIKKTADLDNTILLLGETGTGKSLFANIIHQMGNRKNKPFITINCGAIPDNLLESELFGYVEGAFTGASKKGKKGLFELARDGIIFLDEIGEMPMHLQVKLLNVLQDMKACRVGDLNPYEIKAKIIAATNKDLKKSVKDGEFREDLYYRLNVLPMYIPALRERIEDIDMISDGFLKKYNDKYSSNKKLSEDAFNMLLGYNWPGNIRELENTIERLVITSNEDIITKDQLVDIIRPENDTEKIYLEISDVIPLKKAVKTLEKQILSLAKRKYKTTRKMA
ncbi:MAG: sigma 54-interacting transcriptional regulator [Vallitalea sp.]|nr:sigma 54-interacting transcriptional regulator [Vallitalea sp.]